MIHRHHTSIIPNLTHRRVAFFLATTRNLAEQQCHRIRKATSLSAKLCVGMELDLWSKAQWQALFRKHQVVVCTAQVLVNLLDKGSEYMTIGRMNLLILDECHKAHRNHPYTKAMAHYDRARPEERPRVFGMTVRWGSVPGGWVAVARHDVPRF